MVRLREKNQCDAMFASQSNDRSEIAKVCEVIDIREVWHLITRVLLLVFFGFRQKEPIIASPPREQRVFTKRVKPQFGHSDRCLWILIQDGQNTVAQRVKC